MLFLEIEKCEQNVSKKVKTIRAKGVKPLALMERETRLEQFVFLSSTFFSKARILRNTSHTLSVSFALTQCKFTLGLKYFYQKFEINV